MVNPKGTRKKKNDPTSTGTVIKKGNLSMEIKTEVAGTGRKITKAPSLLIKTSQEIQKVIGKVIINMVIKINIEPKIKAVNLELRKKNVIKINIEPKIKAVNLELRK